LTGLDVSIEVRTTDLYAALCAVKAHVGGKEDLPLLQAVHLAVSPADGNVYVMGTDRYTLGLAVVSIWEDHLVTGEEVDVDLSPEDVGDILHLFRPGKDDNPEAALRLDVSGSEVAVTEVAGMIETEADKHVGLPRTVHVDPYPSVPKLLAASIRTAIALRESAEDAGQAGEQALAELFANASRLARFAQAEKAYKEPLVIQRTAEARGALLIGCSESFVGLFMPVAPSPEDVAEHRGWQAAWLRRLPEPDDTPVAMPDPAGQDDADPEPDDMPADIPGQAEIPVDDSDRAHPKCHGPDGHVCQKLSGKVCVERGCDEAAGTTWGPLWCPVHDMERLDRVSAGLSAAMATLDEQARATGTLVTDVDSLGSVDLKHGSGVVFSGRS